MLVREVHDEGDLYEFVLNIRPHRHLNPHPEVPLRIVIQVPSGKGPEAE